MYKILMREFNGTFDDKIKVIKALNKLVKKGFKECVIIVDSSPSVIAKYTECSDAKMLLEELIQFTKMNDLFYLEE